MATTRKKTTAKRTPRKTPRTAATAPQKLLRAALDVAQKVRARGEQALTTASGEVEALRAEAERRVKTARRGLSTATQRYERQVAAYVKPVRARAVAVAKQVEAGVSEQVGAVLGRFGIPSKAEVAALAARVEQLSKQVAAKARRTRA